MPQKNRNAVIATALASLLFVVSQQCGACAAQRASVPGEGESGAVGEEGGANISLISYKGAGQVSMEVFGIPVEVTVSADDKCQRAIVSLYGAPIIRETRCGDVDTQGVPTRNQD